MIGQKIYNLLIRLSYIALKVLPVTFLPVFLSPEEVGNYGVYLGYVSILSVICGAELWFWLNREYAQLSSARRRAQKISEYSRYFVANYVLLLPVFAIAVLKAGCLLGVTLILLTISMHISQEITRLLVTKNHQLASASIGVIQASWVVALFLPVITIETVFAAMVTTNIGAIIVGGRLLGLNNIHLSWSWFRRLSFAAFCKKLLSALPLIGSTIASRAIRFSPRFAFDALGMAQMSGVFTYYQSITASVEYLTIAVVHNYFLPKLLSNSLGRRDEVKQRFKIITIFGGALGIALCWGACYVFIPWLTEGSIYKANLSGMGVFVFVGAWLSLVSSCYGLIAYAEGRDFAYSYSEIFSFVATAPLYLVVIQYSAGLGELEVPLLMIYVSGGFITLILRAVISK